MREKTNKYLKPLIRTLIKPKLLSAILLIGSLFIFQLSAINPPRLRTVEAAVTDTKFVFGFPTNQLQIDYLSSVFKDKKMDDTALQGTAVFSRGSIWANTVRKMVYGKPPLPDGTSDVCDLYDCGGGDSKDKFFYTSTYPCVWQNGKYGIPTTPQDFANGYRAQLVVMMDLGPNFDTTQHHYWAFNGAVEEMPSHHQVPTSDLPEACKFNTVSNGLMSNYSSLSAAEKKKWKLEHEIKLLGDTFAVEGQDAAGDTGGTCEGQGLSLGWIICGVTEVFQFFVQNIFSNFIQPMMENTPISLDPDDAFYKSWQGFRLLGNIMLIGSLLAIVYSQARGGGGGG